MILLLTLVFTGCYNGNPKLGDFNQSLYARRTFRDKIAMGKRRYLAGMETMPSL